MLRFGSILGVLVFLTIAKIVISNRCLTMLEGKFPAPTNLILYFFSFLNK